MKTAANRPPSSSPNPDLDKVKNTCNAAFELDLDEVISHLLSLKKQPGKRADINEKVVQAICFLSRQIYANQALLLEIKGSVVIVGDIHGQFYDLLRIFDMIRPPPENAFLFLGDYVDRGHQGVEVMILLLALQLKYPRQIYLLRGNHENAQLNRYYGFFHECEQRFGSNSMKVWKSFLRLFQEMPLAAIIEESVFCVHGGLSPNLLSKKCRSLAVEFSQIERPVSIETEGFACDLLWSDPMTGPDEDCKGWLPNDRGMSYQFGTDVVTEFCEKFNINLIVRGHQVVEDGYEFFANRKLVTLFSAPRYCGVYDNAAGVIILEKSNELQNEGDILRARFKIIKPELRFQTTMWYDSETFLPHVLPNDV